MKQGKTSQPKRHHFVPECYLNNFLSENRLFVLNISKVKKGFKEVPHESHPARICFLEDYYKISKDLPHELFRLELEDSLHIEKRTFWNLESKYDRLFEKLISVKVFSRTEAENFADFILQLKLRNPFWQSTIERNKINWIDESLCKITEEIDGNSRFKNIPEEIRELIINKIKNQNKNSIEFSKGLQLYSLYQRYDKDLERNATVRNSLLKSTWSLFKAPEKGPFFITTDNPGGAIGADNLFYNTRFENGFQFFFPVSPEYCLGITDSAFENNVDSNIKEIELLKADQKLVILINDIQIQNVNQLIIGRDKWYLEQIGNLNRPQK